MPKDPKNQKGQKPTKNSGETVKRLEEKKKEGRGGSNRELIEKKEREVKSGR
jgi:hypothetical protein